MVGVSTQEGDIEMALTNHDLLLADAKNRSTRSFVQGLAIDLAVAVALVLYNIFDSANAWSAMDWAAIGFSLSRTVVQSGASYIMRAFLDKSSIPTPLPPEPQVEPAEPVEDVEPDHG